SLGDRGANHGADPTASRAGNRPRVSTPGEHLAPALEHPATLRITISPSLSSAREASVRVRGFLAGHGVSEDEQSSWELVAAEALTNAVSYAPPERADFPVEVEVAVTKA